MSETKSDQFLLSEIAKGSQKAFSQIFERYKMKVFGNCYFILGDRALAEDLSQETWIQVAENARQYQPSGSALGWILTISRNRCLNELRSRKKWRELDPESESQILDESNNTEALMIQLQTQKKVDLAMKELTEIQKIALLMVLHDEKNHAEIAKELNSSVGAIKVLLFRARQTLKQILEEK